jgi:hypothetical protein
LCCDYFESGSRRLACLTFDSVAVRDGSLFDAPIVGTFTRAADSMSLRGPNCWVRWLHPPFLSFGTASGAIFISRVSNSCEISDPVDLCIDQVITYTFAIYDHLAVCTSDSRLTFVSTAGKVFYEIAIATNSLRRKIAWAASASRRSRVSSGTGRFC